MELSSPKNLIKLFYALNKTPLEETGYLNSLYYLMVAQASSFVIHLSFPDTVSQNTFATLPLTVQYLFELQDIMPCHWSLITTHEALLMEAEDFPTGGKCPNDVPLPTFLAYLQPV